MDMVGSNHMPSGMSGAESAGFVNRLPADSPTALATAHVHDLKINARRERDEMRHVLDSMGLGFWDWDIPTLEVWYSSYVHDLLGYDAQDALFTLNIFRTLIHPDDEARTEAVQNAVLTGESDDYRAEFRVRHKDGHWVWIEAVGRAVLRADNGIALRIAGQFICIDQRKQEQADEAFLTSLRHDLSELVEIGDIKRTSIRQLGEHLGVDRVSFGRLSGRRESLIVTMDWLGGPIPPLAGEWKAKECAPMVALFAKHKTPVVISDTSNDPVITDDETRAMIRKTGTAAAIVVPMFVDEFVAAALIISHSTPRNWQENEVRLAQRVAQRLWDSALRARAQERSRADKALLELACDLAKVGAYQRNMSTGGATTSDNFGQIIGHPDTAGITIDEYLAHVHPEDREKLRRDFMRPMRERGDGIITDEHRVITTDEQIRHMSLMAKYHVPRGELTEQNAYSIAILQDVTEQRLKDLESKAAQLQLLKHNRLSAMGMMASTIAHELNQPLAAAANYLALLELLPDAAAGIDTDKLTTYTTRALAKVLEAGEIIRRIQTFTSDGSVMTEPYLLRDLVYRALASLFGSAGASSVSIINAVPRKMRVQVEALMIELSIVNIVRNAVEAMAGKPGGQIHISARMDDGMAVLRIVDNGPGLPDEIAAHVFSPFVTTKTNGNGLGLPLCRTMVEANGGKLTLDSHGPDGAAFRLRLPLADTSDDELGDE